MSDDRTTDATADKNGIQVIGNSTKDGMMTEIGTAADADERCKLSNIAHMILQALFCSVLREPCAVTVDAENFSSMQR